MQDAIRADTEAEESLYSDALDHEGRYVLVAELRVCSCGSPDGYALPDGSITCAPCMGYEPARISVLAVRRWQRASRRGVGAAAA